jgi:DNA-binding transcriptional ArsR family regulator
MFPRSGIKSILPYELLAWFYNSRAQILKAAKKSHEGVQLSSPANDWAALDRALSDLAASGSVEVRKDGEWLAELATLHFGLRVERKNPPVHLWSDERNLTRRVLCAEENAGDRIVLEVQRLEFLRTDSPRAAGHITREQFRARFARTLTEKFPNAVVDSLTAAPDLENSFSGSYVRGIMHEGARAWALLAAAAKTPAPSKIFSRLESCGWMDAHRRRSPRHRRLALLRPARNQPASA